MLVKARMDTSRQEEEELVIYYYLAPSLFPFLSSTDVDVPGRIVSRSPVRTTAMNESPFGMFVVSTMCPKQSLDLEIF